MLKLDIDALVVKSFHTAAAPDARGTVRGAQDRFGAKGTDTEETTPCPSEWSWCPIMSCGSSCEPICDANTVMVTAHAGQTAA